MDFTVYKCDGRRPYMTESSISEYYISEQSFVKFTHVNIGQNGMFCHWLKSHGLDDWMIESKKKLNPEDIV